MDSTSIIILLDKRRRQLEDEGHSFLAAAKASDAAAGVIRDLLEEITVMMDKEKVVPLRPL